mmetsp:Transcript_61761/g.152066  ORF Transcript_61761/g.152066 Transcript_61761/m.152066 type:complete len:241 (-) Transcript_61761:707-1429(-)
MLLIESPLLDPEDGREGGADDLQRQHRQRVDDALHVQRHVEVLLRESRGVVHIHPVRIIGLLPRGQLGVVPIVKLALSRRNVRLPNVCGHVRLVQIRVDLGLDLGQVVVGYPRPMQRRLHVMNRVVPIVKRQKIDHGADKVAAAVDILVLLRVRLDLAPVVLEHVHRDNRPLREKVRPVHVQEELAPVQQHERDHHRDDEEELPHAVGVVRAPLVLLQHQVPKVALDHRRGDCGLEEEAV